MPLIPPLTLYIAWCATMSLMALAYGGYTAARQAQGRPVVGKEWLRNGLILLAISINLSALLLLLFLLTWTSLPLEHLVEPLLPFLSVSLSPILLWYVFDLPLRAARYLTRRRQIRSDAPHPLDGAWPPAASFLDEINAHRGHLQGADEVEKPTAHHPSPALDRVAQLDPVASRPEVRTR